MRIVNKKAQKFKTIYGPAVAVDVVLFTIDQEQLRILLIKISDGPYKNKWALPGGLVQLNETLDDAAKRVLFRKTNIGDIHLEQLYSFGELKRDVRGRVISVAYFALINDPKKYRVKTTPYYAEISWWPIKKLPEMAFDHRNIIEYAVQRLKYKVGYTNIVYSLLAKEFTLSKLKRVYEIILGKKLDKRNFYKRMILLGLIEKTRRRITGKPHRPAQLYQFIKRKLVFV